MSNRYDGRRPARKDKWSQLSQRQRNKEHARMDKGTTDLDKQQTCATKIRYNKAQARTLAAELTKRSGRQIRAYKCPHGSHWHVGEDRLQTHIHNYERSGS